MDVRQNCCDFLQSQLHPTNCLGIRAFADVHTCTDLLQQANAYAGNGDPGRCTCAELIDVNNLVCGRPLKDGEKCAQL